MRQEITLNLLELIMSAIIIIQLVALLIVSLNQLNHGTLQAKKKKLPQNTYKKLQKPISNRPENRPFKNKRETTEKIQTVERRNTPIKPEETHTGYKL